MGEFLTIVIIANDFEVVERCNNALDNALDADYCVIAALSEKQGLSLSQAHAPDCVIIDTSLATTDLLTRLKARTPRLAAILLAGENDTETLDEAKSLGFIHTIESHHIDNDRLHKIVQLALNADLNEN